MNKLIERRLEFLKLEGLGFSLCEIVKQLSKKYRRTERMIYYDAETRGTWQPLFCQIFDLDKARLIVLNRYETVYREAAFMLKMGDRRDKPAALRIMLDVTKSLVDLLGLETVSSAQEREQREREAASDLARINLLVGK